MQHFLQNDNVGLIYKRGFPNTQSGQGFATDSIIDFRSWSCSGMQGGDYISPLYLKNTESSKDKSPKKNKKDSQENADSKQGQWVENFTPEFREFIDAKYNEHFSPEQILGYIYAVLFHKDYREKYIDFLKIDFPKIPFVESKEKFLALSALGQELMLTHLMQDSQQEREREQKMMRMTCNIGLVTCRQVVSKEFTHSFIAHTIMESCYISTTTREINYLFPLYLYQKAQ